MLCADWGCRGDSCAGGIFADPEEGSTGTTICFAGSTCEDPFAGLLFSCALFCARGGFKGDAIEADIGLPAADAGATVGDCDAMEFFLQRDRGRVGEPGRGYLEANWRERGDAFLESLVRSGDVVNMVLETHYGPAGSGGSEVQTATVSRPGRGAGQAAYKMRETRAPAGTRMSVSQWSGAPSQRRAPANGRRMAVWGLGQAPRGGRAFRLCSLKGWSLDVVEWCSRR